MSLAKFMDLLTTRKLFFPCITRLRAQDRNEGTHNPPMQWTQDIQESHTGVQQIKDKLGQDTWSQLGSPTNLFALVNAITEAQLGSFFASCWHNSDDESILMWSRYAPGLESIAIQTTVKDLLDSLTLQHPIRIGSVRYDPSSMTSSGSCEHCFYKDSIFLGENECRLLAFSNDPQHIWRGLPVPVDINKMLKMVYVSPDSEDWFLNLVGSILFQAGLRISPHRTILKSNS